MKVTDTVSWVTEKPLGKNTHYSLRVVPRAFLGGLWGPPA